MGKNVREPAADEFFDVRSADSPDAVSGGAASHIRGYSPAATLP
jgi:hypothetical protein